MFYGKCSLSISLRFCADFAVYSHSAFTDISADQKERMRSDLVSYFCVRLWGEKTEHLFDAHLMIPWLPLTLLMGRHYALSCLFLSEEYVCHSIILLLFPFFSHSIEIFQHLHSSFYTRSELWCSRVSVFPLCLFLSFSLGFVHLLRTFSLSLSLSLVRLRAFCSFHTGLSYVFQSKSLRFKFLNWSIILIIYNKIILFIF